jgi:hypothetical protein
MALAISVLAFQPATTLSQSSGDGSIEGTVTDSTGAAIPNATITATNNATHAQSARKSTSSGVFAISPLLPGTYTVTVTAQGFETLVQDTLDVVAVKILAYNPVLKIGAANQTITVSQAPPVLDTDSAVLTAVMENDVISNLPVLMSPNPSVQIQMRDPTSFAVLTPGTVASTRTPIISGTNEYAAFVYLDGVPEEMINQQGDNRDVSLNMDIDAVDQFQVLSSVPPAQYSGAGSLNFTMKSGGLQFHGGANDFVRNTIFDAWLFSQKEATYKTAAGTTIPAPKNIEHQNELSIYGGGYIPHTEKKLFFFIAYDKFHARESIAPNQTTIPTTLMEQGDFTEAGTNQTFNGVGLSGEGSANSAFLFDPMTDTCNGSGCSRAPFQGIKNGIPTFNVIPQGDLSSTTVKMESFLPNYPGSPNAAYAGNVNPNVFNNNYLNTGVQGRDDYEWDWRWDYDVSTRNRVSAVGAIGRDTFEGDDTNFNFILPYTAGFVPVYLPKQFVVEDAYTITPHLSNQFKYGFTRLFQPFTAPTDGLGALYGPAVFGITNVPAGQINGQFPGTTFGGASKAETITPASWTANNNGDVNELTDPNTYELIDNVQYLKGNHALSLGFSYLFEGLNIASPETLTGVLNLPFGQDATASYVQGTGACAAGVQGCSTNVDTSATGYGYASYLLGAVSQINNFALQYVPNIYNRIKTAAPYAEDSWKVSKKLTIDMGLRWDYMPPYHEKFNHFSFLNTSAVNPATGTPGAMEFAGNYGGATGTISCNCKTPVMTYWKNYGPRLGIVYSIDDKTVIRAAAGMSYSNAGGTGSGRVPGLGGANGGQQPLGFNTAVTSPAETLSGPNAGPSFWLNSSGYLGSHASTALFGPSTTFPTPPTPGVQTQILNAGNYINGSVGGVTNPSYATGAVVPASGMTYEDPYFEGRAAEFTFYNLGFERTITTNISLQVNYAGSESHHSQGSQNMRGYWNNALNPMYRLALGGVTGNNSAGKANSIPLLLAPATSANVAILSSYFPLAASATSSFVAAANAFPTNSSLTIQQLLTEFPQYSTINDALGGTYNVNTSYNSLQVTLSERTAHGLTFNLNYTYSKNLGDEGSIRNGFALPPGAIDGSSKSWSQDRIDRSWEATSQPQEVNIYGVYKLPFGTAGHFGGTSLLTRELVGGWQVSGIYQYYSGSPFAAVWGAGGNCANNTPNAGSCMPSYNPAFSGSARINGSYGTGPGGVTFANASNIHYVNPAIFAQPVDLSTVAGFHQYVTGNAARTRPYNINGPGNQQTSASIRRSFSLPREMAFTFEADVSNLWNKMQWGTPGGSWGITTQGNPPVYNNSFGQVSAPTTQPRDWQFAGRLSF